MIIKRETLAAALLATDTDNSRYYLHAVQADPAKHVVAATNGHVLLVCTDREPFPDADYPVIAGAEYHGNPDTPVCVGADVVASLLKTMPKHPTIPILAACQLSTNGDAGQCTVAATDLVVRNVARIDPKNAGQFPAYERALPKADRQNIMLCIGVPVLEVLIKAAKAVISKPTRHGPFITLQIPVEMTQGEAPHMNGAVTLPLGVEIKGDTITITGAAMPERL